jgi:hypothetical protein
MREDILQALSELIKEKTELKAEKIELGAIDDLEKAYNKAGNKAVPLKNQAIKIGNELIDVNIELLDVATKANKILKQAKELGIKEAIARINTIAENAKDLAKDYNKYGSEILNSGKKI